MVAITSSSSRLLAYGIFISCDIDNLEIDTSNMDVIVTNSHEHLISDNLIHKMGIYNYGNLLMYQEDHNTDVDLKLFDDEGASNPTEQNPDQPQVEYSHAP
ncbi:hypothetical protein Lal_00033773 [Lupinus albus]|nr:hypothetical protein Lal_00033773 [Lupinus albus]